LRRQDYYECLLLYLLVLVVIVWILQG